MNRIIQKIKNEMLFLEKIILIKVQKYFKSSCFFVITFEIKDEWIKSIPTLRCKFRFPVYYIRLKIKDKIYMYMIYIIII